jgi:hypothetical protein
MFLGQLGTLCMRKVWLMCSLNIRTTQSSKVKNGWTAEGWNSITNKFNERYPLAHYSKQQMQEKDKELKSHYKAVRDSRKESGVGWNDSLCMIVAEPELWEKIILVSHFLNI